MASSAALHPRAATGARRALRARLSHAALLGVIVPGAILFLMPFVWMVSTSFKYTRDAFVFPPEIIPNPFTTSNYSEIFVRLPFHLYAWNTVFITGMALAGQLLAASLCAYGFARVRFPGRDVWFLIVLSTIMLPGQVTLIPSFLIFRYLGWIDTFWPLIVPYWLGGGAFNIFLLRQFMSTVPIELDEAARIDGCSHLGIYWRIVLPLVKPALAAVAMFSFLHHWNDFYHQVIYINSRANFTLPLAVNFLRRAQGWTDASTDLSLVMAASLLVMLPPLLLFFFAQRYFIQGVVFTGIKG